MSARVGVRQRVRRLRRLGFYGALMYATLCAVSVLGIAIDRWRVARNERRSARRLRAVLDRGRS